MTVPSDSPRRSRRPAWAGRNYRLLTLAAFVTNGGSQATLIASAFAVLGAGGDGGDVGLVAATRTVPPSRSPVRCAPCYVTHIPPRAPSGGILADLREGRREFTGRPWPWGIVAQFSVANAVVGATDAVYGPLVARHHLGGAGPWGLALGFFGAGTVAGALLMTRLKSHRLLLAGTLCVFPLALPSAALAVPVPLGVLCAVMFTTGVTLEVFGVPWMTAQHLTICNLGALAFLGPVALIREPPRDTSQGGFSESGVAQLLRKRRHASRTSARALRVLTVASVSTRTHRPMKPISQYAFILRSTEFGVSLYS